MPGSVAAIVVAAGSGSRIASPIPKAFLELKGKPLIEYSLGLFLKDREVEQIIAVVPEAYLFHALFSKYQIQVVVGGATRQESVRKGLEKINPELRWVLVHDAARPFASTGLLNDVIKGARQTGACIPGLAVTETVKKVSDGMVLETVPREKLWVSQTPQGFETSILLRAFEKALEDAFKGTDESSLVERLGIRVKVVPGDPCNIKITTPEDWKVAEKIAEGWE